MVLISAGGVVGQVLRACRRHYLYAAGFSALLNLLFLAPVLYMLQVYDRVVPTEGGTTLVFLTLALFAALGTMALLDLGRSRILVRASARLDRMLAGAVLDLSLAPANGAEAGPRRRAIRDFDGLRQAMSGAGALALFDAPWAPIYVLICFLVHPLIGLLACVGGVMLVLLAWRQDRTTHLPLKKANEAAAEAYAKQESAAMAADSVRALGMREALVAHQISDRETMMRLQTEASFASSGLVALSKFVRLILQSLALGLAAWLAINHQISAGAIFASMFLVGRALAPVDQILGAWKSLSHAKDAYSSLLGLFESSDARPQRTQLPRPDGRIEVEDVHLSSTQGNRPILSSIGFSVSPGEVVGIVGPSGAGKSTLLRVIAGAAESAQGAVRFGGASREDWDPERLAQFIGYMPQDPTLLAGTVKENISRFHSPCAAFAASTLDVTAVEAARMTGAHDIILGLPNGYDYELGLGGRGLSAGQAQRIALARAVYGNPTYLLLDEPNSHLDADGDLQLITALGELKAAGVTILIATHKLSILPIVDRLLVLQDGTIKMQGPRDDVMRQIMPANEAAAVPQSAAG
jgi:ATP-binding cassette subfamily C protein